MPLAVQLSASRTSAAGEPRGDVLPGEDRLTRTVPAESAGHLAIVVQVDLNEPMLGVRALQQFDVGRGNASQLDLSVVLVRPEPRHRRERFDLLASCCGKEPLCAVAAHLHGVVPLLHPGQRACESRVRPAGNVAYCDDPGGGKAGLVGDDTVVECETRAVEPLGIRGNADSDNHDRRLDGSPVGQLDRPHCTGVVGGESRDANSEPYVDPMASMEIGDGHAAAFIEHPRQRGRSGFNDRDIEATGASRGRDLGADESTPDHGDSIWTSLEVRLQRQGIIDGSQDVNPCHPACGGQGTRSRTGGDDHAIGIHGGVIVEADRASTRFEFQSNGRGTELPHHAELIGFCGRTKAKLGVVVGADQQLLGQRWTVVRIVRFVAN